MKFLLLWLAVWLFPVSMLQAQQAELMPPEQAFALSARMLNAETVELQYQIQPGYYLYASSLEYQSESETLQLGEADIPPGVLKQDEFFGEVETHRFHLAVQLPVSGNDEHIQLKTTSQGCADIGVCYPPLYQTLELSRSSDQWVEAALYRYPTVKMAELQDAQALPALSLNDTLAQNLGLEPAESNTAFASPAEGGSDAFAALQAFGDDFGLESESNEIPDPLDAFVFQVKPHGDGMAVNITLMPNTYLYRGKFSFKLNGEGFQLGAVELPKGKQKHDEFFGDIEVYYQQIDFALPVQGSGAGYVIELGYQGCVEDRICYPPMQKFLQFNAADGTLAILDEAPTAASATSASPAVTAKGELSEQDRFASIIANESWLIIIGSFFLAGVLLTFTPCVFPMIPILSGIIAGQGDNITTRKAFSLSLVYVLAMALTYAVAGAIVGRFGAEFNIQIWFQDPVILSIFALIFVGLALSMFGFYELQMPSFIQSRLTEISNRQKGGNLVGVAIMGLLSALIVGPCITAPLVGALVFISQTEDMVLGGMALFALGLGMGAPLLLIGTSAGKFLPRAGGWMDAVKAVFGVLLLGVAIWLLERFMPTAIIMLMISALLLFSAVYLGALEPLPEGVTGWRKFWKGLGVLLLLGGVAYFIGAAGDSKDLIQPLKFERKTVAVAGAGGSAAAQESGHVVFEQVKGEAGLQQALAEARAAGQPVMFDFYADWCVSCKEMEKYAFTHPDVLAALKGVRTLQTDVTANDQQDKDLMNAVGIFGPPAILFYDANGVEIKDRRIVGEMSGADFAAHIIKTYQK